MTVHFDPARCLVVAEVGLAHGGDYQAALAYIDAAVAAGVDILKWQVHLADAESTRAERWRVDPGTGERRYDYWRRTAFSEPQWRAIAIKTRGAGLAFGASTFSREGVALLSRVGVDVWKVASGEVTHQPVVEAMAWTGRPVIASAGMATDGELQQLVRWVKDAGVPLALCECASQYPNGPEDVSLRNLALFRQWGAAPGWSDHSGTVWPSLAAAAHGAQVVEVHLALDGAVGPDVSSSLSPEWLTLLVEGVRWIAQLRGTQITPTARAARVREMRSLFLRKRRADGVWLKRGEA